MNNTSVRISRVKLTNFKNVENGEIEISDDSELEKASILGVYGQNGSGKTAIIDALKVLKIVLSDRSLDNKFSEYINVDAGVSKFDFSFILNDKDNFRVIDIDYSFQIVKVENEPNVQHYNDKISRNYTIRIENESLKFSLISSDIKMKKQDLICTDGDELISPKTKLDVLTGKDKNAFLDLIVAKRLSSSTSRSFIFCKESLDVIRKNSQEGLYIFILDSLSNFGKWNLFVIDTTNTALASLNALVFNFNLNGIHNERQVGQILVPLNDNATIPIDAFNVVEKAIRNMNIVLDELIPGLTIMIINNGNVIMGGGQIGCRVQLLSHKNGRNIPLRYESEGIKKIVAILQLLINMYSNPSTTVVIDELDAGVFEYLLGELLQIISENGKGQLIFTSHNLRPLEKLNKFYIAFTTTNPNNRYVRLTNVKTHHNLRRLYFRGIEGEIPEYNLYSLTNSESIISAFEKAGCEED